MASIFCLQVSFVFGHVTHWAGSRIPGTARSSATYHLCWQCMAMFEQGILAHALSRPAQAWGMQHGIVDVLLASSHCHDGYEQGLQRQARASADPGDRAGCPNGCARPYMAELGFVGDGPNSYQFWLGGSPNQTRLAEVFQDRVKIQVLHAAAALASTCPCCAYAAPALSRFWFPKRVT